MSKKRNQVLFTKPDDPTFLKLIKAQAGYKEDGPSIESKRAKLENALNDSDSDFSGGEEEQPQIVVVKSGDLTAAEAETERLRIETEEATKRADLTERVIFKAKTSSDKGKIEKKDTDVQPNSSKKSSSKKSATASKLSFAFDDDEEVDE